jgi:hypothetical protein
MTRFIFAVIHQGIDFRRVVAGADVNPSRRLLKRLEQLGGKLAASTQDHVWVIGDVAQAIPVRDFAVQEFPHEEVLR